MGLVPFDGAEAAARNPQGVAVIIGNREYSGSIAKVDYAVNDADAFRKYVVEVLGFDPDNIIDLRNATSAQMQATFGTAANSRGRLWRLIEPHQSEVIVYYSGHGVPGDGRPFLLPVDADPSTPQLNGYPLDQLYENLGKLDAKQVEVFLDACFSGSSWRGALTRTSGIGIAPRAAVAAGGVAVLAAAAADQVAVWDDDSKHGLFTRYLLTALYGAADTEGDKDGTVTLGETKAYLDRNMTRAARRLGYEQNPDVQGDAGLILAAFGPSGPPAAPNFVTATPAAPAPAPLAAPVVALQPLDSQMFANASANVRVAPAATAALIISVPKGTGIAVTGKAGDWYQVKLADGRAGFVLGTLLDAEKVTPAAPPQPDPAQVELAFWNSIKDSGDPQQFEDYLRRWPSGTFASLARSKQQVALEQQRVNEDRRRDDDLWSRVRDANQVSVVQGYLSQYPNGAHAAEARLRVQSLSVPPPQAPQPQPKAQPEDPVPGMLLNLFQGLIQNGK